MTLPVSRGHLSSPRTKGIGSRIGMVVGVKMLRNKGQNSFVIRIKKRRYIPSYYNYPRKFDKERPGPRLCISGNSLYRDNNG